jgi:hypothetical protein
VAKDDEMLDGIRHTPFAESRRAVQPAAPLI